MNIKNHNEHLQHFYRLFRGLGNRRSLLENSAS